MTKHEAIENMKLGFKVTNQNFYVKEYFYMKGMKIFNSENKSFNLEDLAIFNIEYDGFNDDWELFEPKLSECIKL